MKLLLRDRPFNDSPSVSHKLMITHFRLRLVVRPNDRVRG
jgi:hypothetical protein